jgi:hypothetical protein
MRESQNQSKSAKSAFVCKKNLCTGVPGLPENTGSMSTLIKDDRRSRVASRSMTYVPNDDERTYGHIAGGNYLS